VLRRREASGNGGLCQSGREEVKQLSCRLVHVGLGNVRRDRKACAKRNNGANFGLPGIAIGIDGRKLSREVDATSGLITVVAS